MSLEDEFERDMLKPLPGRTAASPFIRDKVKELGGVGTARFLLKSATAQKTLKSLANEGILEHSMEALVIQPKYKSLFKDWEIALARKRLEDLGYFSSYSGEATPSRPGIAISGGNVAAERDIIGGDVYYVNSRREEQYWVQVIQDYFDKIFELLEKGLISSDGNGNLRILARNRTLTVLRALDSAHQLTILRFLREVSDSNAHAVLFSIHDAELKGLVPKADFGAAYLVGIDRQNSNLAEINFNSADLRGAQLQKTDLTNAILAFAMLSDASLSNANLSGANLQNADLSRADLFEANLNGAMMVKTNLNGTYFQGANLTNIRSLVPYAFQQVARLEGAIMPNGNKWQGDAEGPYELEELAPYFKRA